MNSHTPSLAELEARLAKLERQNRRWKHLGLLFLLIAGSGFLFGQAWCERPSSGDGGGYLGSIIRCHSETTPGNLWRKSRPQKAQKHVGAAQATFPSRCQALSRFPKTSVFRPDVSHSGQSKELLCTW